MMLSEVTDAHLFHSLLVLLHYILVPLSKLYAEGFSLVLASDSARVHQHWLLAELGQLFLHDRFPRPSIYRLER